MSTPPALTLPDLPRWARAHDLARDPTSWQRTLDGGGCIGRTSGPEPVICVWGAPPAAVVELAVAHPHHTLLLERERTDLADALVVAGRTAVRAVLHTLPDPATLPDDEGAAPLPVDAPLDHLPPALRADLAHARTFATIWAAWVDSVPACFAYPSAWSARWFDCSVDTVTDARQLGLATRVAAAMIRAERVAEREPVWGATCDNIASLRLAARLGFELVDELWVVP